MFVSRSGLRFVPIVVLAAVLSGCSDDPPPIPTLAQTEIGGNGQLGIIIGGAVTISDLDGTELATSTTDASGDFPAVTLPESHDGPIVVEIAPAGDGSSTWLCDYPGGCPNPDGGAAIPFGGEVPYTATLYAVVLDPTEVNAVAVNPLTTAVYRRAVQLGLSVSSIEQADEELAGQLSELLGVEITTSISTIPNVDLVNGTTDASEDLLDTALVLSSLNAGLASLVSSSANASVDAVVNALADGFAQTGEFGTSTTFNSGEVNAGELIYAAEQQVKSMAASTEISNTVQELSPSTDLAAKSTQLASKRNEVAPVPPQISGSPATSVAEDTAYAFTPTAVDPDGDTLTFSIANKPSWATFNTATGALTGTPENGDVGTTTGIAISVSDGNATVDLAPFDLVVVNVNDAPTISGTPPTSVDENAAYSFAPTANDVDVGDSLTFSLTGAPSFLAIDPQTGVVSGTPGNADVGIHDGITVSVTDGQATTSLTAFSLTVVNVNDPPTIAGSPPLEVLEDATYTFAPAAADVDSSTLTFSASGLPGWASIDPTTGVVSGTPTNDDVGTTSPITVSVSDGALSASLAPFSIVVVNVNDPPSIGGTPASNVDESALFSFTPTVTDVDAGDTTAFSATNLPVWLTIDPDTGLLSGTPNDNHVGIVSGITVTVTDSGGLESTLGPFSIEVINVPPTISGNPPSSTLEDELFTFQPTAAGGIVFSITNKPAWASFDTATGVLSGTPVNGDVGVYADIQISMSDNNETVSLAPFTLEVVNVNDAPTISGTPAASVDEDAAYSFTPQAADVDNDAGDLTFSIVNKPAWAAFSTTTGQLSGTPVDADVGTDAGIVISVSDGALSTPLETFSITVNNTNDAPAISGTPSTTATEDVTYTFTPTGTDDDLDSGDVLSFSINKAMAVDIPWATFTMETGQLTGTPGNADVGTIANIVISVTDSAGVTADLPPFDLTIDNEPLQISGTPDPDVDQDVAYSFTPMVQDAEDVDAFSIVNKPDWATFDTTTGNLAGTPDNSDVQDYADIQISVSDTHETSNLPPFTITVNNVNDAPVISGTPSPAAVVDIAYSFVPTATDDDLNLVIPNGETLTFSITGQPDWNVVNFDTATGELSGTPNSADETEVDNVTITVTDAGIDGPQLMDSISFTIEVFQGEQVRITWTAPTTRENGDAITTGELLGYEVEYYEESSPGDVTTVSYDVLDNNTTDYLTPYLGVGTWHFAVRAVESTGFDGDLSTEDTVAIDGIPGN